MFHVHLAIFSYVRGIGVNFELEAQAERDTGITDEQWIEAQESTLAASNTYTPDPFGNDLKENRALFIKCRPTTSPLIIKRGAADALRPPA